jgi:DNA-binding CsgD family transcriptional regulator
MLLLINFSNLVRNMFKLFKELSEDKKYEKMAEGAIRACLQMETSLEDFQVIHDAKLKGKSGVRHQVDVVYECIKEGQTRTILVECKNYNKNKVKLGDIRSFYAVIEDLSTADKEVEGVFLTSSNFQRGVIRYAQYKNIKLGTLIEGKPSLENYLDAGLNGITQALVKKTVHEIGFLLDDGSPFPNIITISGVELARIERQGLIEHEFIKISSRESLVSLKDLMSALPMDKEQSKIDYSLYYKGEFVQESEILKFKEIILNFSCDIDLSQTVVSVENRLEKATSLIQGFEAGEFEITDRNGVLRKVSLGNQYRYSIIKPVTSITDLLNEKERYVLNSFSEGKDSEQILNELSIKKVTLKKLISRLLEKLDLDVESDLINYCTPLRPVIE